MEYNHTQRRCTSFTSICMKFARKMPQMRVHRTSLNVITVEEIITQDIQTVKK